MRVFLLGTGYVGAALLKNWAVDASVWTTTTTKKKLPLLSQHAERTELLFADETERLTHLLESCDVLVISVAPKQGSDYQTTYRQTAESIRNALKYRQRPLYLLYLSSTGVYGDHSGNWVIEQSKCNGASERSSILRETEEIYLIQANNRITPCILRLGGIYGPDRQIAERAKRMSDRSLPGSGGEPTNHIHLDDIVRAARFCASKKLQGIFNLVNDDHPTRKELYERILTKLELPLPSWDKKDVRNSSCKVSNRKIKQADFTFSQPYLED